MRARWSAAAPHANSGAVKPPTSAPGSLRALSLGRGGGARARRGLPYSHNSSGTAAALNPAKSFAAIRITTTPYPQQVTGSQQATTSPKTLATTSQPSDGQWDCNFISGYRSVVGDAGI